MKTVEEEQNAGLLRKHYETFVRLYKGRDDVIAEQQGEEGYTLVEGQGLSLESFIDHLYLRKTYAIYNMDDLKRVHFGLFDIDVLHRKQGWSAVLSEIEEKKKESLRITKTLLDVGLRRKNILIEFPTVGFHTLIFLRTLSQPKISSV